MPTRSAILLAGFSKPDIDNPYAESRKWLTVLTPRAHIDRRTPHYAGISSTKETDA